VLLASRRAARPPPLPRTTDLAPQPQRRLCSPVGSAAPHGVTARVPAVPPGRP